MTPVSEAVEREEVHLLDLADALAEITRLSEQVRVARAGLEAVISDCQVPKDCYEKNGPTWTGKDGHEYEDTSYVLSKMTDLQDIAREALTRMEKNDGQ